MKWEIWAIAVRHCTKTFAALLIAGFLTAPALSDAPPTKPAAKSVCSPNRMVCALMDPAVRTTIVARDGDVLWTMPGWFRVAALADDGDHLIFGHDGINLLPLDAGAETVVLTFVRRGQVIREVTLSEVLRDLSSLERTISHLNWGNYLGFDAAGHYVIQTVEGRRLAFDVTTGRLAGDP